MTGFTPGPLGIRRGLHADNTGGYDYAICDSEKKIIGEAFEHVGPGNGGDYDKRPARNNAALWAEAPAMYEALNALVEEIATVYARPLGPNNEVPMIGISLARRSHDAREILERIDQ